jgi:hypothetical protein
MATIRPDSVIVIGNGESRKSIDLTQFKHTHSLIGCNAIHRDLTVDHLICCDRRMAEEAHNNPLTKNTKIYVREEWYRYYRKIKKNKNVSVVPDLPYAGTSRQDLPEHWGSGGYAVLVAAELGFKTVKLIGFDLYSKNNKVNNVYKDTQNYSDSNKQSVDYSYWVYQIAKIFRYYPETNFLVLNEAGWEMPKEWQRGNVYFENICQLSVDI